MTQQEWIDLIYAEFPPDERPLELHEDERRWIGSRAMVEAADHLMGRTQPPLN